MSDRGQTVYDFLLGVVLFLVVVVSVFAIFPDIFEPFFDPSPGDRDEMADRVASELIENSSVPQEEQTLRYEQLNSSLQSVDDENSPIRARAGVPRFRNIHVEIQNTSAGVITVDGEDATWGTEPQDVWSVSVRNVRLADVDECDPACQLVVRVW